ncbi:MAG: hypothetical protein ACD_61C00070G0004 [uncultured bacterium]|nr:MAG: hypothetical protein ACD_61C00070G0004 [uncultured bacterium]
MKALPLQSEPFINNGLIKAAEPKNKVVMTHITDQKSFRENFWANLKMRNTNKKVTDSEPI